MKGFVHCNENYTYKIAHLYLMNKNKNKKGKYTDRHILQMKNYPHDVKFYFIFGHDQYIFFNDAEEKSFCLFHKKYQS